MTPEDRYEQLSLELDEEWLALPQSARDRIMADAEAYPVPSDEGRWSLARMLFDLPWSDPDPRPQP